jgi:hypothetical protein
MRCLVHHTVRIGGLDSQAKGFALTAVAIAGQQMMTPDEVSSGSLSETLRNLCNLALENTPPGGGSMSSIAVEALRGIAIFSAVGGRER